MAAHRRADQRAPAARSSGRSTSATSARAAGRWGCRCRSTPRSTATSTVSSRTSSTRTTGAAELHFLGHLATERLRLITSVEQIDLDTLRLLGMFGAEASAASALGMLDLLNVFSSPEANDVVNFSLDLLPSVLETKRASGQQTFSVDGYAGLARRGTLDSLMLSELAFDEDLFDQRYMENEVFYYAREKQHEEDRRLHYIIVDATASMRGQRAVFARGLALTLDQEAQPARRGRLLPLLRLAPLRAAARALAPPRQRRRASTSPTCSASRASTAATTPRSSACSRTISRASRSASGAPRSSTSSPTRSATSRSTRSSGCARSRASTACSCCRRQGAARPRVRAAAAHGAGRRRGRAQAAGGARAARDGHHRRRGRRGAPEPPARGAAPA